MPDQLTGRDVALAARRAALTLAQDPEMRFYAPDVLGLVKIVAPALHPDHTVTMKDGKITIRASIACPACGLHGFVTDSEWSAA